MKIALVAALADNRVIGRKNSLPWHLPDDMKRFRALTVGHCVLMGHRTYASIGRPLPERTNIVLSRNPGTSHEGVHVSLDLEAGLAVAREGGHESVFVIGGETVYAAALSVADALYLTRVHADIEGDARFPDFDESGEAPGGWRRGNSVPHPADERHAHAFTFEDWTRG